MDSKKSIILATVLLVLISFFTVSVAEAGQVRGYTRRDGTYVQPHYRTSPDGNPYNNYNFPGNYNPNKGTITPGDSNKYLDQYYHPNTKSYEPFNGLQWQYK